MQLLWLNLCTSLPWTEDWHRVSLETNHFIQHILGDPGAVSRAGRKVATKVFKHGWKSPWVPTLTRPFPKGQANAGSWLGTKNALYYCAQSANSFSWVLFVSSYTTAIISPKLPGSFTKLSWPETKELLVSRRTFRMLSISGSNLICTEKILFLTDHNVKGLNPGVISKVGWVWSSGWT